MLLIDIYYYYYILCITFCNITVIHVVQYAKDNNFFGENIQLCRSFTGILNPLKQLIKDLFYLLNEKLTRSFKKEQKIFMFSIIISHIK